MPPIRSWLSPECIKLELENGAFIDEYDPELYPNPDKERRRLKALVIEEICDLFVASGRIHNRRKFLSDLSDREARATTAIGNGLAIPHVRTQQLRMNDANANPVLVFARSTNGVEFGDPNHEAVHYFFGIVASSFADYDSQVRTYTDFFRWIAMSFREHGDWLYPELQAAQTSNDVLRIFDNLPNS